MPGFVRACSVNEVPPGTTKRVTVASKEVAVFNHDGRFYAVQDICPHEGGPLSSGFFEGENITCPWHGATFHILTGKTLEPPAGEPMGPPVDQGLVCFTVRVVGLDLEIAI